MTALARSSTPSYVRRMVEIERDVMAKVERTDVDYRIVSGVKRDVSVAINGAGENRPRMFLVPVRQVGAAPREAHAQRRFGPDDQTWGDRGAWVEQHFRQAGSDHASYLQRVPPQIRGRFKRS